MKPILMTLDNVRIIDTDDLNVTVERLETYYSPRDKKDITSWRFKGHYGSVLKALRGIVRNEWHIDRNGLNELESYVERIEKSNAKILKAVGSYDR